MSINLNDGQEIYLQKNDEGLFEKIRIKIGWQMPYKSCNGLWFSDFFEHNYIECHAYMLMYREEMTVDHEDIISYCNSEHYSQSVRYLGKCLEDSGSVSEIMLIDPEKIPEQYSMIVFMVDVSKVNGQGHHFGMIRNAYMNISDEDNTQKICHYNLSGRYDGMTSMLVGALCRCESGWEFLAIGEGSTENIVDNLIKPDLYEDSAIAI